MHPVYRSLLCGVAAISALTVVAVGGATATKPHRLVLRASVPDRAPLGGQGPAPGIPSVAYTVQDLGTLGGPDSAAAAINNRGQVVGTADTAGGAHHAFLWEDGRMRDLGTLGGPNSEASGINDRGQIVGQAGTRDGQGHAFIWSDQAMHDLGTLGGKNSVARGINSVGEVVGTADMANGKGYAFLYSHGKMRRLAELTGDGNDAYGINNKGQIAGTSRATNEPDIFEHAFVYDHGRVFDLNRLGAGRYGASAFAINDRGQVLGDLSNVEEYDGAVWQNGQCTNLGYYLYANAINNQGQMVGTQGANPAFDTTRSAVVWRKGQPVKLDLLLLGQSDWVLHEAESVNDHGQIVGAGTRNGKEHAFLLTPVRSLAAAWSRGA
jgi:probable HAF family extracellular repeat protein